MNHEMDEGLIRIPVKFLNIQFEAVFPKVDHPCKFREILERNVAAIEKLVKKGCSNTDVENKINKLVVRLFTIADEASPKDRTFTFYCTPKGKQQCHTCNLAHGNHEITPDSVCGEPVVPAGMSIVSES